MTMLIKYRKESTIVDQERIRKETEIFIKVNREKRQP